MRKEISIILSSLQKNTFAVPYLPVTRASYTFPILPLCYISSGCYKIE
jgi:hypothetical protein